MMEELKAELEHLISSTRVLDTELLSLEKKIDLLVQKILTGVGDANDEKALKDLERQETELEEMYGKRRLQLVYTRQKLRKKLLTGKEDDAKKLDMSALLASSMFRLPNAANGGEPYTRNASSDSIAPYLASQSSHLGNSDSDPASMSQWVIKEKELEYNRSDRIGKGAFGDVFKGKLRGKDVAIKKLNLQLEEDVLNEFNKEVSVMVKLRHPNVLLFMGVCNSPPSLCVVTELMTRGSVAQLLRDEKNRLPLQTRMLFARDAALGMAWLHSSRPPFLHLDLKTANLLVDDNWVAKVSDFGLSQINTKAQGRAGSPLYMAPEMLLNQEYDTKADVYSFGVVLWELFTCDEPYRGLFRSFDDVVLNVAKKGLRPTIPESCPVRLRDLITRCWHQTPSMRPNFVEIVKSNVFFDIIIEALISQPNELGRQMWRVNFLEKTYVPWDVFVAKFFETLAYPMPKDPEDIQLLCLKDLVVKKINGRDAVTCEDFGRMLEWFGPLEKGNGILKRIESMLRSKGFFGMIETQEAEKILSGKKRGYYLVRFSSRDPGCFVITVLSKDNTLKHYRISHKAGSKYILGDQEYDSMEAVIKYTKKELTLNDPVTTGSKYINLFTAHDRKLASQGYMSSTEGT